MKKQEKQYEFVRTTTHETEYGTATVKVYREIATREQVRENLRRFYDACNQTAQRMESEGIDTSRYFYSPEQLEEAVKSGKLVAI